MLQPWTRLAFSPRGVYARWHLCDFLHFIPTQCLNFSQKGKNNSVTMELVQQFVFFLSWHVDVYYITVKSFLWENCFRSFCHMKTMCLCWLISRLYSVWLHSFSYFITLVGIAAQGRKKKKSYNILNFLCSLYQCRKSLACLLWLNIWYNFQSGQIAVSTHPAGRRCLYRTAAPDSVFAVNRCHSIIPRIKNTAY